MWFETVTLPPTIDFVRVVGSQTRAMSFTIATHARASFVPHAWAHLVVDVCVVIRCRAKSVSAVKR